ncbi:MULTISPECIES: SatD family protein [unclassified Candidatus Frackibacter]|uniref:SatD family protein n=1 Tax=unclassified Candidatus Frackibacter TaxID=2648818 RepID=UPI000884B99E|nr:MULTISPECIES: SatD family protein [unclassified Candidatus Frackibacter]SDC27498.1 SatD family (SatD) [Candidatus Frackibacter sp. WG11]SEM54445.1 SatD family (SatD) [Candidatus Frackibacter sp. WG12]SFL53929.1 SatD family (SatD) [Candidatus Frackibacter sp. WG13]
MIDEINYCAVIGDIVESKKADDRNKLKDKFKNVIKKINSKYKDVIIADFLVQEGDSVQGLLSSTSISYDLVQDFKEYMKPSQIVFGIGIGTLSTALFANPITSELDGEAYHRAKKMLKRAKNRKPGICYSFADEASNLINTLVYFIESNQSFRTTHQKKIVKLYKELETQEKVAKKLDISQATVSANLKKALYPQIKEAENNIKKYLKVLDDN